MSKTKKVTNKNKLRGVRQPKRMSLIMAFLTSLMVNAVSKSGGGGFAEKAAFATITEIMEHFGRIGVQATRRSTREALRSLEAQGLIKLGDVPKGSSTKKWRVLCDDLYQPRERDKKKATKVKEEVVDPKNISEGERRALIIHLLQKLLAECKEIWEGNLSSLNIAKTYITTSSIVKSISGSGLNTTRAEARVVLRDLYDAGQVQRKSSPEKWRLHAEGFYKKVREGRPKEEAPEPAMKPALPNTLDFFGMSEIPPEDERLYCKGFIAGMLRERSLVPVKPGTMLIDLAKNSWAQVIHSKKMSKHMKALEAAGIKELRALAFSGLESGEED